MTIEYTNTTEEVDLGLQKLPLDFDLQPLFPGDRLLRLHPNWFVSDFLQKELSFTTKIKDYVTEEEFPLSGSFIFNRNEEELLTITLAEPINREIRFLKRNDKLTVQISSIAEEPDPDDPLLLWIRAIKEYIRIYLRKTPVTLFFRLLMNKMVLGMNPSQRKICLMIAKITAVELVVIVLLVIGYVAYVL
jgi:hypothetical protein